MADVISTCSQNDTSANTSGGGIWYTTLTTWEAGAQGRFGATPNHEIVECYNDFGGPLNDSLTILGWGATTATDHPTVRAAAGQGHGGVVDAGFAVTSNGNTVYLRQPYCEVRDIQIISTSTSGSYQAVYLRYGPTNCLVERCIVVVDCLSAAGGVGIYVGEGAGHVVRNNLFIGDYAGGANRGNRGAYVVVDCVFDNNTIINFAGAGILSSMTAGSITNCAITGTADDYDIRAATTPTTSASGDNSGNFTGLTLTPNDDFVDPSVYNFNVYDGGGSILDGSVNPGTDLSGAFTDDIAGNTRSVPWEIGAYEIAGAAPGVTFDGPDIVAQTGTENVLFSFNENGEGNVASRFTGATTYAYAPGSDTPAGITVNATTGNLEGTPTVNGTFNITIEGSD